MTRQSTRMGRAGQGPSSSFTWFLSPPGLAVVLLVMTPGCRTEQTAPPGGLPEGVLAEVAGDPIDPGTVARAAKAGSLTLAQALDATMADAVFAAEARATLPPARIGVVERTARARVLLEKLWAQARARGPATVAELDAATQRRWWELDRPVLTRTTHAVVISKGPADDPAARALAERVAMAAASAPDASAFRRAAEAVPHDGFEVKVEDLKPCTADGRVLDPASPPPPGSQVGRYAAAYASAADAIAHVPGKSPVVRTSFGYHVIFASERIAERRIPEHERRVMLESEVHETRAGLLMQELLAELRRLDPVEIDRAAQDLTERVKVTE